MKLVNLFLKKKKTCKEDASCRNVFNDSVSYCLIIKCRRNLNDQFILDNNSTKSIICNFEYN